MEATKAYARKVYDALMLCFEMWDEMAQHPEWVTNNAKVNTKAFLRTGITCAACHFDNERVAYDVNLHCAHCIMRELWPNECSRIPSPFYSYAIGEGTTSDARIIADFAKEKADRIAKKWGL